MAMAAYAITPVTTQRISVRWSPRVFTSGNAVTVPTIPPSVSPTATAGAKRPERRKPRLAMGINTSISYVKAAVKGNLYAEATEQSLNPKLASYSVLVTDDDKNTVAIFQGMVYRKQETLKFDGHKGGHR